MCGYQDYVNFSTEVCSRVSSSFLYRLQYSTMASAAVEIIDLWMWQILLT